MSVIPTGDAALELPTTVDRVLPRGNNNEISRHVGSMVINVKRVADANRWVGLLANPPHAGVPCARHMKPFELLLRHLVLKFDLIDIEDKTFDALVWWIFDAMGGIDLDDCGWWEMLDEWRVSTTEWKQQAADEFLTELMAVPRCSRRTWGLSSMNLPTKPH